MRDADIRGALRGHLASQLGDEALVIDELGICAGAGRCDVAVISEGLWGYEIKSDVDRIDRLEGQIASYQQVFDYSIVVTGERLVDKVAAAVPASWGLSLCTRSEDGTLDIAVVRAPERNARVDPRSLAQLLWRDELLDELRAVGAHHGLSRRSLRHVWDRAAETFDGGELRAIVQRRLQARGDWRAVTGGLYPSGGSRPRVAGQLLVDRGEVVTGGDLTPLLAAPV